MHALLVLDQSQDQVAFVEGASPDSVAMVAVETLLVDGGAGTS